MFKRGWLRNAAARDAACQVAFTPKPAANRGMVWVIGAFLICPCHLPLTLGLATTLLAGTAAGAMLRGHPFVAGTVITVAWATATWHGFRLMRSAEKSAAARTSARPTAF